MTERRDLDGSTSPEEIRIDTVRSPLCRVIHVDGVWGGPSPGGFIHMALFSDRLRLPDGFTYEVKAGQMAEEKGFVFETGIRYVREIEADVLLNSGAARALITWLTEKLAQIEVIDDDRAE